ncbi:MAG: 30S ribosome-binding factor RbfA [Sedimentisphaerales bacterium]|nr:30S ribosome-binding factor RbfA [Sedimentisphaerales bacterium]
MPTRRQEKVSHLIRESVSDTIAHHLNDPRIELAFVSVTRVEVSADLRIATVYISIFGGEEKTRNNAFAAILHARPRIQSLLAERVQSRFCPVISIRHDEQFKKALETMKIIDDLAKETHLPTEPKTGVDDKDSIDQGPQ